MKWHVKCLTLAPVVFALYGVAQARDMDPVFDKPISEKTIVLAPDTDSPQGGNLRCIYYSGFMVKEIDTGQKGADKLSITPASSGQNPPCQRDGSNEVVVKDWYGYFEGVKGHYVFFGPDDGYSGVFGYGIISAETRTKLFEINVQADFESQPSRTNIHDISISGDTLTISYRKAFGGKCSLYDPASDCWNTMKKELGLADGVRMPDCRNAYEAGEDDGTEDSAERLKIPTMIGYEVKHVYRAGQSTITQQPGAMSCWTSD